MDELEWEVAEELQLDDDIQEKGFANMTTREVGQIGGNIVKKMITYAEKEMAEQESYYDRLESILIIYLNLAHKIFVFFNRKGQ